MKVNVSFLTGKISTFAVKRSDSVGQLKGEILATHGIPFDQQRLVVAGIQLENHRNLSDYQIQNASTICLMYQMSGMISTFATLDESNNFNRFLLLGNGAAPSNRAFLERWPDACRSEYEFWQDRRDLVGVHLQQLCRKFMDTLWPLKEAWMTAVNGGRPEFDMKVKFTDRQAIVTLLSADSSHESSAVEQLLAMHPRSTHFWSEPVIALRCTRGPTPGAIGWHFDGDYATHTVQLALNDDSEYEGETPLHSSSLCFSMKYKLPM
jgi:hypothetical protein